VLAECDSQCPSRPVARCKTPSPPPREHAARQTPDPCHEGARPTAPPPSELRGTRCYYPRDLLRGRLRLPGFRPDGPTRRHTAPGRRGRLHRDLRRVERVSTE